MQADAGGRAEERAGARGGTRGGPRRDAREATGTAERRGLVAGRLRIDRLAQSESAERRPDLRRTDDDDDERVRIEVA